MTGVEFENASQIDLGKPSLFEAIINISEFLYKVFSSSPNFKRP